MPADPPRSLEEVEAGIVAELAGLEEPLARYEYLVAQGDALPAADGELRSERYAIPGCQVSVWIRAQLVDGRLHLAGDSDARINRGMVALLLRVLDGRTPAEILAAQLTFLDRTGLRGQLSPARANGLAAMVRRIREYAAAHDGARARSG